MEGYGVIPPHYGHGKLQSNNREQAAGTPLQEGAKDTS